MINRKLWLIILFIIVITEGDETDDFIKNMEKRVSQLGDEMYDVFVNYDDQSCQTKSYNVCQGTSQVQCYRNFPTPQGCLGNGALYPIKSVIQISQSINQNNLTNSEKYDVCASAQLQPQFQKLNSQRNNDFITAFVGLPSGILRSHPLLTQQITNGFDCRNFDIRSRPWFTATTVAGKKNVVLMVDLSTSSSSTETTTLKLILQQYIRSLQTNDNLLIVQQGQKTFTSEDAIKISQNSKQSLVQQIDNNIDNILGGSYNFSDLLTNSYEILNDTLNDNKKIKLCCQDKDEGKYNVVFSLFTKNKAPQNLQNIFKRFIDQNSQYEIQLIIFHISSQESLPYKQLAEDNNGTYFLLPISSPQQEIRITMQKLNIFMAQNQTFEKAIWSEFYQDAFDLGLITTVTKSVYYWQKDQNNETQFGYFIGVAGIDVTLQYLQSINGKTKVDIQRLLDTQKDYQIKITNPNVYQNIRNPINNITITQNVFVEKPQATTTQKCCFSVGALIGIIIGCVLFVGIIVGVLVFICKQNKYLCFKQKQKTKIQMVITDPNRMYNNNVQNIRNSQTYANTNVIATGDIKLPPITTQIQSESERNLPIK